jgi:tetratricopeptide (TPR) repeat protein
VYYAQAVSCYGLGEYEKGLELCEQALEYSKPASIDGRIYCSMGVFKEALGDEEGALEAYQKVISLDEDNWQAYYSLSRLYQNQGDEDAAQQSRAFLETASEGGDTRATYYLGVLSLAGQDTSKGRQYLEQYVAYKDIDKETDNFLADAYSQLASCAMAESDLEQAQKYLEQGKAAAGQTQGRELLKMQVLLLEQQGEYEQARQAAEEYLQQYSGDKAMKKEYRFLKTRDATAKGNE